MRHNRSELDANRGLQDNSPATNGWRPVTETEGNPSDPLVSATTYQMVQWGVNPIPYTIE